MTEVESAKIEANRRIGANARSLRKAYKLTLDAMAERLTEVGYPVQASQVSKLERGQNEWHLTALVAYSIACSTSIESLLLTPAEDALLTLVRAQGTRGAMAWIRLQE